MVKKFRPPGKAESKPSGEEETIASGKELNVPSGESGGFIDFYYFFNGIGILTAIGFSIIGVLRYVFHVL